MSFRARAVEVEQQGHQTPITTTPIATQIAATSPCPSGLSPPTAASLLAVGDAVGSAIVPPGVMVVVGPNGYGRSSVDMVTPLGPIVIVSPPTTVVVVPVPGPTVYVDPPITTTDAPTLVIVAPPTTANCVSPGLADFPPSVVPCAVTPAGPNVIVSPPTTVVDEAGPYVMVVPCITMTDCPIAVTSSPPATTISVGDGNVGIASVWLPTATPDGPMLTVCPLTIAVVGVAFILNEVPPTTATLELTTTCSPPRLVVVGAATKTPPTIDGRSTVAPAPTTSVGLIVKVTPLTMTTWVGCEGLSMIVFPLITTAEGFTATVTGLVGVVAGTGPLTTWLCGRELYAGVEIVFPAGAVLSDGQSCTRSLSHRTSQTSSLTRSMSRMRLLDGAVIRVLRREAGL
ncbi:hypothetical protein B0T25DRAFT_181422 [Lasiosphaeria hispida]|uniref:Uncharacterized protein n=1 Tax=Lasiosphaeria hispida TaxID=260671 RepID=A0AAJ0HGL0_9PEZI|nr:hypothetical protein B0T25DRAFT_181422 [Lasiosphaeria hispida]